MSLSRTSDCNKACTKHVTPASSLSNTIILPQTRNSLPVIIPNNQHPLRRRGNSRDRLQQRDKLIHNSENGVNILPDLEIGQHPTGSIEIDRDAGAGQHERAAGGDEFEVAQEAARLEAAAGGAAHERVAGPAHGPPAGTEERAAAAHERALGQPEDAGRVATAQRVALDGGRAAAVDQTERVGHGGELGVGGRRVRISSKSFFR